MRDDDDGVGDWVDQQNLEHPPRPTGRRFGWLRIAAVVLLHYLLLATVVAMAALCAGCGATITLRTEQVPTASRMQWEGDITNRVNQLDIRLKQLEQKEEPNA